MELIVHILKNKIGGCAKDIGSTRKGARGCPVQINKEQKPSLDQKKQNCFAPPQLNVTWITWGLGHKENKSLH